MRVIHRFVKANFRKLTVNEEANCETCALAEKVKSIEGDEVMLCNAALYHIPTLSCYVKKHE
jgi:hypothetical protein